MKYFYLLYTAGMFAVGLVSLGVVTFLALKTKEALLRYFLLFFTFFSLLVAFMMGLSHVYTNLAGVNADSLEFIGGILGGLVMFTTALFMHFLVTARRSALKNVVVGVFAIFVAISQPLSFYVLQESAPFSGILQPAAYIGFLGIFFSMGFLGLSASRTIGEPARKQVTRLFATILLVMMSVLFFDLVILNDWLDRLPIFSPLVYAVISVLFVTIFVRLYGHHTPESLGTASSQPSFEALYERHNITSREQDVIGKMLQGRRNKEISEELFISVSTVKKHITSIYQKLGLKSRYELMTLFTTSCHE